MPVEPWFEALHFEGFAAEDHVAEGLGRETRMGGAGEGFGLDELAEGAGGLVEDGDLFLTEEGKEVVRAAGGEPGDDDKAAAEEEGAPEFPDAEVEGGGVEKGPDVVFVEAIPGVGGFHEADHVAVGDLAAFGEAGGAAGVNDVGQGIRVRGNLNRRARRTGSREIDVLDEEGSGGVSGDFGGEGALGQEDGGPGVLQHEGEAPGRVGEVDRKVGGAGFENAEQGRDERGAAVHAEADEVTRLDAGGDEGMGDEGGTAVEFRVGPGGVFGGNGGAVGILRGGLAEPAVEGSVRVNLGVGGLPVLEEELAFGRSGEVELGKRGGQGEGGELLKELDHVAEETLDGFVVEGGGLIRAMEAEGVGAENGQGEGDAGELVELEGAVGKGWSARGAEGVGVVVVFEDEEVVEWSLGGAEAAAAADEGKRGMLVGTEVEPVLAERLEEREEGLA